MPENTYSKKRAWFDVFMSIITGGFWSIWMVYARRKNY